MNSVINSLKHRINHSKKNNFRDSSNLYMKLRSRLILYILIVILVPLAFFGIVIYKQTKDIINTSSSSLLEESISYLGNNLDYYLNDLLQYTSEFTKDPLLNSELDNIYDSSSTSISSNLQSVLSQKKNSSISGVYLFYKGNPYTIYSRNNNKLSASDNLTKEQLNKLMTNPNMAIILGTNLRFSENGKYEYVFTLACLPYRNSYDQNSLLVFDFEYSTLSEVASIGINKNNNLNADILILDNQDNVMYSKDSSLLTINLNNSITRKIEKSKSGVTTISQNGQNMQMAFFTSKINGWKTIGLFHVEKILKTGFFQRNYIILLILICVISICFFSFKISSMFLKPIGQLTSVLSEDGKVNMVFNSSNGNYDPADSSDQNSNEPLHMDNLVHKIYSTQIQQKEAQLKSLQNQINPHFLYNTLESIRGVALYNGVNTIAEMSKRLSLFFRYSISDNVLVSIKDEIRHLENYITIQNFRHEDKFELTYNIPQKIFDYKILKLSLQPLVENAIKHGLEMRLGKGKIDITAYDLDNIIKIEIKDNGVGIPPKKLEILKGILDSDLPLSSGQNTISTGTGVGIQNVNSRIKIYFGKAYGLKYESSEQGTTVQITIPAVES